MLVFGLTGSIGMGKSTTAAMFREAGVPVFDSDAAVHALYRGEAVPLIAEVFPAAVSSGSVDRTVLSGLVLDNPSALKQLEGIVHPLVRQRELAFRSACRSAGYRHIMLDIPLLFETEGEARVDLITVVSAPEPVQKSRVLARQGMTEARFAAILAKQLPDTEKRRRAHAVIGTGDGLESARRAVGHLIRALSAAG